MTEEKQKVKEPTPEEQWKMKKLTRRFENIKLRNYLRGRLVWNSADYIMPGQIIAKQGQYVNPGPKLPNPKKVKLNKGRKGYGDCLGNPPSGKKFKNLVKFFVKRDEIREKYLERRK